MRIRHLYLCFTLLFIQYHGRAAYFSFQPFTIVQPNRDTIRCFVSGDEYYNWIHDHEGYTIVQASDGYYYYGISSGNAVKPGIFKVNEINPANAGIAKWAKIPESDYLQKRTAISATAGGSVRTPNQGTLNNIVVYIRFADDTEFTDTRQYFDDKFNLIPGVSLQSYYSEVSYNQLDISSTHYPACGMNTNLSYQDLHPRGYFQPFNSTTNPTGFINDIERTLREHTLLSDAINWININSPVPASLVIDNDNDGNVDNVCFVIRGSNGAWSSLLWAHSWSLFSYNVFINGKKVWKYTFQPETQSEVKTICHEMFHTLGAPDLYHYCSSNIQPTGFWDLMEQGSGHMGAYMKWKYSNNLWIASIPEITVSGNYTLNPLSESTNNCYKIKSPYSSDEFFVLEYRKDSGFFESNLPGSGLLVYRISSGYYGNVYGPPDEVYIYRPNGTTTANGSPSNAFFSSNSGRTLINDTTNPSGFLQSGIAGGLNISNISQASAEISFTVTINWIEDPQNLAATSVSTSQINLQWQKNDNFDNVLLAVSSVPVFGIPVEGVCYAPGAQIPGGGSVIYSGELSEFIHSGLSPASSWYYKLWSVSSENIYSIGINESATTYCSGTSLPYSQSFDEPELPGCWLSQQSPNANDYWLITNGNMAGGTGYELQSVYQTANPGITRMIITPFNTLGMTQLNLNFSYLLDDYAPGATLRIQSSKDLNTWTNEAWYLATAANTLIGPETVSTIVTSNLNSEITYIAFAIEGDLYKYDFWYIDDISVTNAGNQIYEIITSANPAEAGTVAGSGSYPTGQNVNTAATSSPGWNFVNWTENNAVVSLQPGYTFIASQNRNLIANFSTNQVTVSVSPSPVAGGYAIGGGTYQVNYPVTLTAYTNEGYSFVSWTDNGTIVSSNLSYSFIAASSRSLEANFEVLEYIINTDAVPQSGGLTNGAGIYPYHSLVTVVATTYPDWIFEGWYENGVLISQDEDYSFQASMDRDLEAHFAADLYSVSVTANPQYSGIVSGGGTYSPGSQVTAVVIPESGWAFINWTQNNTVVSTNPEYIFYANSSSSLVANLLPVYFISTHDNPTLSGYTTGSGLYIQGDTVTLTAFANPGYMFTIWTEDGNAVSNQNAYQFPATSNRNLEANFIRTVGLQNTTGSQPEIYPNPTQGELYIELPGGPVYDNIDQAEVFNTCGEMVMRLSLEPMKKSKLIHLDDLQTGIYLLRLADKDKIILQVKVVLLK